ncbi:hypothetical protein EUA66_02120 [TM7 phylum sp. oral taxon 349]|nr:hypothetical protein EUA66_02120 [TM7 phylum sp. oral taxon 349]
MMEEAVAPHLNLNQVAESRRRKFRFASMIVCVIAVACTLTGISLHIYNASGAVQVDLSRPGYQSVRKEATANTSDEQFSATGNLDAKAYSQFNAMYDRHAKRTVDAPSFGEEALSDDSLQIFADTSANNAANPSSSAPESPPAQ